MSDDRILRSWKEIADYLKCDRKTCARWEAQFGLPIHRIDPKSPRSRVFAYVLELDRWMSDRRELVDSPGSNEAASAVSRRKPRFRLIAMAAGLFGLAAPLTWVLVKNILKDSPPPIIAVNPFIFPSNDTKCAFIAESFKSEIIRRLNLGGNIRVMVLPSGISVLDGAGRGVPLLPAADYVLNGEISLSREAGKSEDEISWSLRLDEFGGGAGIWRNFWRMRESEYLDVFSEADRQIRDTLHLDVSKRIPADGPYPEGVLDAYLAGNYLLSSIGPEENDLKTLYVQGKFFSEMGDAEANETAIGLFEKALKYDPGFGMAYLGLAQCFSNYVNFGWKFDVGWLNKADEMLAQAAPFCAGDPEFYRQRIETLLLRDVSFGGDTSSLRFALAREGLAANPYHGGLNSIVGYCYFRLFDLNGRESDLDEALRLKYAAHWAEPYSVGNIVYAQILMLKRRFAEALNVCAQIKRDPDSPFVDFQRGEILYYQGNLDACRSIFSVAQSDPKTRAYTCHFLGMIAARKGERAAALEALREIEILAPQNSVLQASELRRASIYAGLGETGKASELLGRIFVTDSPRGGNHIYRRLFDLDRNFDNNRYSIKALL